MNNPNENAHIQTKEKTFNVRSVSEYNGTSPNNYFGNNSFSGADMVAIMHITGIDGVKGTYTLGSLQTLSYSTSMQRMPIRSIGNVNAKDYVMGQRTIAGSLVFAVFDKHFAYEAMKAIKGITEEDYHFLADELPPFDITITFANEYGKVAKLAIYGVRLVNEGQVMSINDIYTENTYQYVALDIDYLSDQTTNTSGAIYSPLKPNENSISEPIQIEDVVVEEDSSSSSSDQDADEICKYQLVYVKTTDAYTKDGVQIKGKAQLDLFKRVDYGAIVITSEDGTFEKTFELTPGVMFPIVDETLPPATYIAKYTYEGNFSKGTTFTINLKSSGLPVPEQPIIVLEQKLDDGTFTIGVQAVDSHTVGIQYTTNDKDESSWQIIDPPSTYSVIKGLREYTTYYFRAYNNDNVSTAVSCLTDERREHLFSDFKNFVTINKNYLANEYPHIEKMWDYIWSEWKSEPTGSISVSVEKIKPKLNLIDKDIKQAYDLLCCIATNYEKRQSYYVSQKTTLSTPKLLSNYGRWIEFDKNIASLEIVSVVNGFKTIIPSISFQTAGNKYRYLVNSKYAGIHIITAKNNMGLYAPALLMNLPPFQVQEVLMKQQLEDEAASKSKMISAELALISPVMLSNKDEEKQLILQELTNDLDVQKTGIGAPMIEYITDAEVKVKCSIPSIYTKECFLCLCQVSEIGVTQLNQRVKITNPSFEYVFYNNKNALLNNTRYAVWIEDENNKIVSKTTGFDFNSSSFKAQELKNHEIIDRVKKSYIYENNKSFADSYIEEVGLSDSALYRFVIEDVIRNVSNMDKNKFNYFLDATTAEHKNHHFSVNQTAIQNLTFDTKTNIISGKFKLLDYSKIAVVHYNGIIRKENSGELNEDGTFTVKLNKDYDYMYFYLSNQAMTKVSSLIVIDIQNKKTLGMKVEVKW